MKMKFKNYLIIIILFFSYKNLYSQIDIGIHGGLNLSTISLPKIDISDVGIGFLPAYSLGVRINYKIVNDYSFIQEINYSIKGHKVNILGTKEYYNNSYIEMPFLVSYKPQNISFEVGPYLGFALKQVIRNSSIDYVDYGKIGNNQDDEDTLKPIDIGVKFGISISLEKIVLRCSAAFGISNTRPGGGGGNSVKNISTQCLIGFPIYLFDDKIKKK